VREEKAERERERTDMRLKIIACEVHFEREKKRGKKKV